jgi:hypothetical protein
MRPPESSRDLTREQLEALERRAFESLAFLRKLLTRIEQLQFPPDDKLRRDVTAAYSAVLGLRMTLHYLGCERMRHQDIGGPQSPHDTYWKAREKRKP